VNVVMNLQDSVRKLMPVSQTSITLYSNCHKCPIENLHKSNNFVPNVVAFNEIYCLNLALPFHKVRNSYVYSVKLCTLKNLLLKCYSIGWILKIFFETGLKIIIVYKI
jgi:hypothetical protein